MTMVREGGLVLLADVGGTHVRFALADPTCAQALSKESIRIHPVARFASFSEAARAYLDDVGARPRRGVFAVAGPVDDEGVRMTNHAWALVRSHVQRDLGLESVRLVNDFAAMGHSIAVLREEDLRAIGTRRPNSPGSAATQTFAVLGPGTGLGVGALLVRGGRRFALQTEGGHLGFAPRNDEEIEILRRLAVRFGRVSNERLLCGSGLVNIQRALCEIRGLGIDELAPEDITSRAGVGEDDPCSRAVELFCGLLGAVAGDMALAYGAWDGVYIGGGMAPVLLPWLERGGFRARFEDKGRYAEAVARVPTTAIVHPCAGLLGAAVIAVDPLAE